VKVVVRNCDIRNNTLAGVLVQPSGTGSGQLTVSESSVSYNGNNGVDLAGAGANTAALFNTSLIGNSAGLVVQSTASSAFADNCIIAYNGNGVFSGVGGSTPVTRLANCTIFGNTSNGFTGTGTTVGFTNNSIGGNSGNETLSSSAVMH
jgi:hypothetical protein